MSTAQRLIAPIAFGVLALAVWQLLVVALRIPPFVLPSPLTVGQIFGAQLPLVARGALVTGGNALVGLALGAVVGILLAALSAALRIVDRLAQPVVTALAVVPIVALAPVLYTMFGAGVQTARQLIAALAVFVPVYVTTLRGLRQVAPVHRDLMRAYAATRWQATRTVTLPGAVPYLFTGLRIASSLSVISALVAEYFGGPVTGLATAITSAAANSNFALAYAFVLGAVITGLVFFVATLALERLATRHRPLPL